jgi:HlyD family secretion protein
MSATNRRIIFWSIFGLLLIAGLVYAFMPQPVPVDVGVVSVGPVRITIDDEGKTRVREIYTVSAPLPGRAMRITHKVGDRVVGGETVLATIEPGDPTFLDVRSRTKADSEAKAAEAALALATAEQNRAQAELDYALAELSRAKRLAAGNTISDSALDRAVLEAKSRRAALDTAKAATRMRSYELVTARASLIEAGEGRPDNPAATGCCVPVRAPVSGSILKVLHESAGIVGAGDPLIEIGDPQNLEIIVDLLSTDAVKVEPGAKVLVEAWGGGKTLPGQVRRVEPTGFTKVSALGIEEQRVNVIIDFSGDKAAWRRLGHGFRVQLRIVIWERDQTLRLPVGALFRAGDAWAAFVVADGKASLREVSIGQRNAKFAEVLEGVKEDDKIVQHPSDRILDGVRVIARD